MSAAVDPNRILGWSRVRRSGTLLAVGIGSGWLVAFALATAAAGGNEQASQLVGDVVYVIGVAVAAALSVLAAFRAQPHQRLFWRLLALSNLGWLGGEIVWSVLEVGLGREVPFPSVADGLYLGSYVMVLPAIALGSARLVTRERRSRALLDTSIVVVAIAYVGWMALIRPQLAWGFSLATATGIAYPLLGVAILMLLATTGQGIRAMPRSLLLVGAGFLASALTDTAYTYFVVLHEFVAASWLNVGWQLEAVLLSLAALAAIRGEQPARKARPGRDVGFGVVVAGTAAVVVLVARELTGGQLSIYGAVLACFAISALVLRMYVTTREKESIARRLDRSLSLLHATLESTADGILVVNTEGRITGWNEKFVTMWDVPLEVLETGDDARVIESTLRQLVEPEQFLAKLSELSGQPTAHSFDVIDLSDGRVVERYSQPQQLDGYPAGRVWSFRDITDRRRLEEDLRQAQKMEAVGRLAGGIAHDFNNLLTAISGYAEVIAANPAAPRVADDARQVQRAASRAAELTHQLLAFGRKQMLLPQQIDLAVVVEDVQPLLRSLVGEAVHLSIELDRGHLVEVDPGQMEQVIVNLVLNARDGMPEGGTLSIRTAAEDGSVTLTVSDTGIGMDDDTLARATEPFFTTKATGEGTGLGLATAVGIIEQSGGTLAIASRPGAGTRVTVALPALARSQAA